MQGGIVSADNCSRNTTMPIESVTPSPQAQAPPRHKRPAGALPPRPAAPAICKDSVSLTGCSKETQQVVEKTLNASTQGATVANWAGTVGGNDGLAGIS